MRKRGMKVWAMTVWALLLAAPGLWAGNDKEQDRVKESGTVMKEILDIPDNIPKDLFDKAECVVVLPSAVFTAVMARRPTGSIENQFLFEHRLHLFEH